MSTPAAAGFRMPAEWEPHERCWMAWPCHDKTWGDGLEAAREAYAEVAKAIARFEPVTMVANPPDVVAASLRCGSGVEVLSLPLTDSWVRDTGPTFVVDDGAGRVAGVDWRFNAWGGNYAPYDDDAALAGRILERLELPRYAAPIILEGGAIHVDGEGTALTTADVVLNPNRNPGLTRADAEAVLGAYLGIDKVIWLDHGLADDVTDGHVDNVACFARPGVVLLLAASDEADANHARLEDSLARLDGASDAKGRPIEVVRLAQPPRREHATGARLPLSHLNFYLANGAVVMPLFEHEESDNAARRTLAKVFPEREIVPVPALDIVAGGGGIHCITQQQPKAR
jgi:agmatine deiminase